MRSKSQNEADACSFCLWEICLCLPKNLDFVNCDLVRLHCSFVRSFNLLNFSVSRGCKLYWTEQWGSIGGARTGLGVQKLWNWDGYYQIGPSNLNYVDFIISPESSCFKKTYFKLLLVLFLLCYLSWLMLLGIFTELLLQILTGHQDNAEFALAMCPTQPYVLSGGW